MLMRENVNNEVRKDSSILRFVKLQEACQDQIMPILHFLFLEYAQLLSFAKKKIRVMCHLWFVY